MTTQELSNHVKQNSQWIKPIQDEMARVVVGQRYLIDGLLTGLLANGHILLEGVPGLAKTLTVKTLAACVRTKFQRIAHRGVYHEARAAFFEPGAGR